MTLATRAQTNPAASSSAYNGGALPDFDRSLIGFLNLSHTFRYSATGAWESTLSLNRYWQQHLHTLDALTGEATSGPRVVLNDNAEHHGSIRIYGIAGLSYDGSRLYRYSPGIGMAWEQAWNATVNTTFAYEFRKRKYHTTELHPDGDDRNSYESSWQSAMRIALTPDLTLGMAAVAVIDVAAASYQARREAGISAALTYRYDPKLWAGAAPWNISGGVLRRWARYWGPDPNFDIDRNRFDVEWRWGGTNTIPLTDRISLYQQVQTRLVHSTIEAYSFRDTAIIAGAIVRF